MTEGGRGALDTECFKWEKLCVCVCLCGGGGGGGSCMNGGALKVIYKMECFSALWHATGMLCAFANHRCTMNISH